MIGKTTRRALTLGATTVAAFALAAGPASAHFCFKTELNEHARAGMAGSANWISVSDILAGEFGLCEEGIEIVTTAAGVTPDTLINGHGTMAGGTLKKGPDAGNKAISHLDFEAADAAFPAAFEACGMPLPTSP